MDEFIKTVLLQLPNFAVAVLALYWQATRMDKLIDSQSELIKTLLDMCKRNEALTEELARSRQINGATTHVST